MGRALRNRFKAGLYSEHSCSPVCFQRLGDQRKHNEGRGVADALRRLKDRKAIGIDAIHTEMLKVDFTTSVRILCPFINELWEREEIPEDWTKGLKV